MDQTQAAKLLLRLQRARPGEAMQAAVPGHLFIQGPAGTDPQNEGVVVVTLTAVHFVRKRVGGLHHLTLPLSEVRSVAPATARFADSLQNGVNIESSGGRWFVVAPPEESELLLDHLGRVLSLEPVGPPAPQTAPLLEKHQPGAPAVPQAPSSGSSRAGLAWAAAVIGVVLVLAGIGAGMVISGGGDQDSTGQTVGSPGSDDEADATSEESEPTDVSGDDTGSEPDTDAGLGSSAQTATYDAGAFTFDVTTEADWTVPESPEVKSGGAMRVWDLFGPDGEEISIYHTPDDRASPAADRIAERRAFDGPVSDSELLVLDSFPVPGCEDRLCDDYVLNGDFGGIAILATDSDGPISAVAADIARSVSSN